MSSPFEQSDRHYSVLVNDKGQHSLWPVTNEVPAGWAVVFEDKPREECLVYVETNWVDMRPRSSAPR